LGKKKEDDEGILFYLLLALGMHLSGQNLAWKNTAAVVCSRETMVAVICFVGKLLEPALVSTGDMLDEVRRNREGAVQGSHGENDAAGRRRRKKNR